MADPNSNDIMKKLKSLTESDMNEIIKKLESASGIKAHGNSANLFKEKLGKMNGSDMNNLMKEADHRDISHILDKFKIPEERKDGK